MTIEFSFRWPFIRVSFRSRKLLSATDMQRLAALRPGESYKGFTAAYPGERK